MTRRPQHHEPFIVSLAPQGPKPLANRQGETRSFHPLTNGRGAIEFGVQEGNIALVRGVDVWVNPENTDMEMARVHDPSISGVIRYLGASWSSRGDSDDAVFCALLDRVSADWGVDRPVPEGRVFLAESGLLKRTHGVKMIAHVACVTPIDANRPGSGYQLIKDWRQCVGAVLEEVERFNRGRTRLASILFPLIGAGEAGGDPRASAQAIVNACAAYFSETPKTSLKRILFLAYTEADRRHFVEALDDLNWRPRKNVGA